MPSQIDADTVGAQRLIRQRVWSELLAWEWWQALLILIHLSSRLREHVASILRLVGGSTAWNAPLSIIVGNLVR